MEDLNAILTPGMLVRHPAHPDWGVGQVQSNISGKVTVNFRSEGKIVVIDKSNILIVGGYEADQFDWSTDIPSPQILLFNIPTKSFKTLGEMMNNRIYFGIAQCEDLVYIIGGSLKGQDLKQCAYFEISTMTQRALPSLQQAVRGPH